MARRASRDTENCDALLLYKKLFLPGTPLMDNVKTVVDIASGAAFPLERAFAVHASYAEKSCQFAGGSVCASMVCSHVCCVIYNGSLIDMTALP